MKRFIAILLSCAIILTGCAAPGSSTGNFVPSEPDNVLTVETTEMATSEPQDSPQNEVSFAELSDPELLSYVEENVYNELVSTLDSEDYFVENVSTVYISNEYLEEVAYNSQANVYFGYTLAELDEYFQDTKYVFTLGEDGQTTVQPFEAYDDTYDRVIKNVAIGTGVILVCVTVSVVSATGAPAVSVIFAASAKSGTIFALSSGTFSALVAGIVTHRETGAFEETIKAATLAGSEGFKWGAITGAFDSGIKQTFALKGAAMNGLSMNQAAQIQRESGLPLAFIKSFHSVDEYNVYKTAGLQMAKVNGKWAYIQPIDWDFVDIDGFTNAQRVGKGLAPVDLTGKPYELHHIGQKADSPLAILTNTQHHGNDSILHNKNIVSEIDRTAFNNYKKVFWKQLLEITQSTG